MHVLVTNDDGVDAPGLASLAAAMADLGHDVTVAAPLVDHSGFGAAIGPIHVDGRVAFERLALDALPGVVVVGVDGPPALAALCGTLGAFGPRPDVVVSGSNAGANTGRAALHSGTVGAALTAAQLGTPAMAVSLELGNAWHWDTAADVAGALVDHVADTARRGILNVNVPNRPLGAVAGFTAAAPAEGGTVQTGRRARGGRARALVRSRSGCGRQRRGAPGRGLGHGVARDARAGTGRGG
jgi:5'-nucleotidase